MLLPLALHWNIAMSPFVTVWGEEKAVISLLSEIIGLMS